MISFLEAIQNKLWPYGKFSLTIFLSTVLTYRLISISQKKNRERTLEVKILPPPCPQRTAGLCWCAFFQPWE